MRTFKTFFEKTVIGLIEDISLDGIGNVKAKIDSGNSCHNVIHGENITKQGNKISFTTVNNKHIVKDVVDTISINVGAGHVEERPVIMFRMKFGGQEFDNIPFSVGNRSNNEYKILIGKEFIKELDALIDVNSKNIANKQLEVSIS